MTVPNFGQVPGQLPPGVRVPRIGAQQMQEEAQKQKLQAAVGQLSMHIYARLAVSHISGRGDLLDPEQLQQLAKDARTAARCYFEGVEVEEKEE